MSLTLKMPLQVWIVMLAAFAIGTAEFVIARILPQVADSLVISGGQVGNLTTAYALAIVVGGPTLTLWLVRFGKAGVLIGLMVLFVVSNLITALTSDYHVVDSHWGAAAIPFAAAIVPLIGLPFTLGQGRKPAPVAFHA